MQKLPGVFLEVNPAQVDVFDAASRIDAHLPADPDWPVILGDLIPLGKVRIKIVLAREERMILHSPTDGQDHNDGMLDGAPIDRRQRPGYPRHTGQVRLLGTAPYSALHAQNILVAVRSCACTSRPMTGLYSWYSGSGMLGSILPGAFNPVQNC